MRVSFNRRSVFPFLVITMAALLWSVPGYGHENHNLTIHVQSNSLERTTLGIEIEDFGQEIVRIDGDNYLKVYLDGEGLVLGDRAGFPLLPAVYRSIMIPDTAKMEVQVLEKNFFEIQDVDLLSNKGNILRTVDPATVPYTFNETYETDAWFPGDLATLRDPYILRDVRGVVVEVFPFQYNPVQKVLRVYTNVVVDVTAVGEGSINILDRSSSSLKPSRSFHALYQNHFLNSTGRTEPPPEDGDMLVISHGPFMAAMQPFVNWKNSIGISTSIVD
ncbi:MAG: C25 family peptidase propeptide domain-containing protein, partial [Planctomycetota bacterium]